MMTSSALARRAVWKLLFKTVLLKDSFIHFLLQNFTQKFARFLKNCLIIAHCFFVLTAPV